MLCGRYTLLASGGYDQRAASHAPRRCPEMLEGETTGCMHRGEPRGDISVGDATQHQGLTAVEVKECSKQLLTVTNNAVVWRPLRDVA